MKKYLFEDNRIIIEPINLQDAFSRDIKSYVHQKDTTICLDLRNLNMFDAIKTGAIFSAYVLTYNIYSKIEILSDCIEVIKQLKILSLSNVELFFTERFENKSKIIV